MSRTPLIICDDGEERSGIPRRLRERGCIVEVERLASGDYRVSAAFAVERKSPRDFVDALRSRRLYRQLQTLSETYEAGALLIEGDSWEGDRELPTPLLAELYQWLSLSKNLHLWYSPSTTFSARLLHQFAEREQFGRDVAAAAAPPVVARNPKTPLDLLLGFPGVGPRNAEKLLARFGSVHGVVEATVEELAATIGAGRASHLYALLRAR